MLVARQPIRNWLSGGNLGKEYNGPIAKIVAVMMGLGLLLHLGSLWTTGFLSYLGIALVGAGLLLSFLPVEYTASPSKKSA
jgi:Zn-dependent membrane protease YugP